MAAVPPQRGGGPSHLRSCDVLPRLCREFSDTSHITNRDQPKSRYVRPDRYGDAGIRAMHTYVSPGVDLGGEGLDAGTGRIADGVRRPSARVRGAREPVKEGPRPPVLPASAPVRTFAEPGRGQPAAWSGVPAWGGSRERARRPDPAGSVAPVLFEEAVNAPDDAVRACAASASDTPALDIAPRVAWADRDTGRSAGRGGTRATGRGRRVTLPHGRPRSGPRAPSGRDGRPAAIRRCGEELSDQ